MPPNHDSAVADSESRDSESRESEFPGSRIAPTQFRLLDLFTEVTLFAVVFAILIPVLRRISIEHLLVGVGAIVVQLASAIATFVALAIRRNRMLRRSGKWLGVAFSGDVQWKHWPVVKCGLMIAGAGCLQFAVSLYFMLEPWRIYSPILLLYSLQLGYFFGSSISRLHWRSYPGVIEFYEHGITLDGRTLTPWNRVELRESSKFSDRIVLVSDAANISSSRTTQTAQVAGALRKHLLEFAANARR